MLKYEKGEQQYLDLLKDVLDNGKLVEDRTNTGCIRVFSRSMRFDLSEGIPLLTTKKIRWENVVGELLWMLSGKTDLPSLRGYQCKPEGAKTIWTDDFEKYWQRSEQVQKLPDGVAGLARWYEDGGVIYGSTLRHYCKSVDQLTTLIENIKLTKANPNYSMGRRLKCEFWNPTVHLDSESMDAALPACHTGFQCMVDGDKLNLKFNMRSNDLFLGCPYNVFFYGVLTHILAKLTGLKSGELVYDGTDCHIYSNHVEQVKTQIVRTPKGFPELVLPEFETLEELLTTTAEDFKVTGYDPHGFIAARQAS